jgi:hypothetical protein
MTIGNKGAETNATMAANKWRMDVLSLNSSLFDIFIPVNCKFKSAHSSRKSYLFLEKVDLNQTKKTSIYINFSL